MFGKAQDHLEVILVDGAASVSGISFFFTPSSFSKKIEQGSTVDIAGYIETDWKGGPRIRIVDVV